ncbi:MAG: ATP-binding cassette domain-containing protein, partial [Rickettsiales bacterium]|nr:ATP-binding cassette domain-containing protein [Rickettsiales bacterium]
MKSVSLLKISFSWPASSELFSDLSVAFDSIRKVALVGDNGSGKTTLLKIVSGELVPDKGRVVRNASVCRMPQIGAPDSASGGERQRTELARTFASGADILLLDEPTNNLDGAARVDFFARLRDWQGGAVIVSHDRELLNRMDFILEMFGGNIRAFGGNYDFYIAQKAAEREALESQYANAEKRVARLNDTLRVAQNTRQHHEAKQKKDKAKNAKGPKILANNLKGKSKETEAKARRKIQMKLDEQSERRQNLSEKLRDDKIKIPVPANPFAKNDLIRAEGLDFSYGNNIVFRNFNFSMRGGERVRLAGENGSGKTTLIKLILG